MWTAGLVQRTRSWIRVKTIAEDSGWISSSQASSVIHMNNYQSKTKLWRIMKKKENRARPFNQIAIDYGNFWEDAALRFAKKHIHWHSSITWVKPGMIFDPFSPFCCSPDALGYPDQPETAEGPYPVGIEVKCPYSRSIPQKNEDVSRAHVVQAFVCMMITRASLWYLVYFNPEKIEESTIWRLQPSQKFWDWMKIEAEMFLTTEQEPKRRPRNLSSYVDYFLMTEVSPKKQIFYLQKINKTK